MKKVDRDVGPYHRLRGRRHDLGATLKAVAELSGIPLSSLHRWEMLSNAPMAGQERLWENTIVVLEDRMRRKLG